MSILISGDTHGDYDLRKLAPDNLARTLERKFDTISHLIIAGDWGAIWSDSPESLQVEEQLIAFYDALPWETLVVLGNHEGYDRIGRLPWTTRFGAPVREVSQKISILQHGNIYTVDGLRFFVFGGGESLDRNRRVEGQSWWPQEIPTKEDLERGQRNLSSMYGQIDYVVTHTCPRSMAEEMIRVAPRPEKSMTFVKKGDDRTVAMLTELERRMQSPKRWYFGHYHFDHVFEHYQCLYHSLDVVETGH